MKNIIIIACCRSGHNFIMDQIRSWLPVESILHNFEDILPVHYRDRLKLLEKAGVLNTKLETIPIIIVRDLLNWWASYLTWITQNGTIEIASDKLNYAFKIWTEQVKEAYDNTRFIPGTIDINYDMFKKDPRIRKGLCFLLGGNYSEERIDRVLDPGNGSSFDKGIPGSEMKTSLRYEQVMAGSSWELYRDMLRLNPEAVMYYRRHFKLTDDQLRICNTLN